MDHPANLPACLTIKKIDEKDANKKKSCIINWTYEILA